MAAGSGERDVDLVTAIRDAIIGGQLAPGQRLPESDLSEQYQASRGAVRSALARLENEGLVSRERNRGARVRPVSLAEAIEITEVRCVVEGLCAAKAAAAASAEDRATLRELAETMTNAVDGGDIYTYTRTNAELHRYIRDMAEHATAADVLDRLRSQSVRYQYSVALLPGRPAEGLKQHLAVIDAICSGSEWTAEQAMRDHLRSVIDALQQLAASNTTFPNAWPH